MKILSYNIFSATGGKKLNELAQVIKGENPDLVALQEVDRNCSRSKSLDLTKELAGLCGYGYYEFFKTMGLPSDDGEKNGEYGTAILSRYPIISSQKITLSSPNMEQRILTESYIQIDGKKICFYNAHLSFESQAVRLSQFQILAKVLQNKTNFILCGDFNVFSIGEFDNLKYQRISNCYNKLKSFEGNAGDACCIDNIYYSDDFDLINSGMIKSDASDHNPIYATLK